jgi:hypothetical protein
VAAGSDMADRERRSGAAPRPEPELLADGPTLNVERCPGTGANDLPRHHTVHPTGQCSKECPQVDGMCSLSAHVMPGFDARVTGGRGRKRLVRDSVNRCSRDRRRDGRSSKAQRGAHPHVLRRRILLTGALVHPRRTPNGHSRGSANEREGRCRSIYRGSATRRRLGPG